MTKAELWDIYDSLLVRSYVTGVAGTTLIVDMHSVQEVINELIEDCDDGPISES